MPTTACSSAAANPLAWSCSTPPPANPSPTWPSPATLTTSSTTLSAKRLYLSCGEGFLDTIEQTTPDTYKTLSKLPTAPGARTSYFSPGPDRLYLAVPDRGSQKAEIRVLQPQK
jgi:hypothetical protein